MKQLCHFHFTASLNWDQILIEKKYFFWGANSYIQNLTASSSSEAKQKAIYSILFYPITLGGRRGTTDEFATIPFHLDLFSATLVELAKSIPVHSLILSSHLFFCLPLFLFPFTVPCKIFLLNQKTLRHGQTMLAFVS